MPYYRIVEQMGPVSFIIWDKMVGPTNRAHAYDLMLAEIADLDVCQKEPGQGKQPLCGQKK